MRGRIVELIPDLENGGFATRVPDIPACGEGDTEAAVADLKEALGVHIEEFGLEESTVAHHCHSRVAPTRCQLTEVVRV